MRLNIIFFLCFISNIALSQTYRNFTIIPSEYYFNLNGQQGSRSKFIEYDEINQEFIRSVEKPSPTLEIFNIKTHKIKYIIPVKTRSIGSFTKTANNTFWVHDNTSKSYLLLNLKGKVLRSLKEQEHDKGLIYLFPSNSAFSPIVIFNNQLYVSGMLMFKDFDKVNSSAYKKTGIIQRLDSSGSKIFIGRPATVSLTSFYGNMNGYSLTINKNLLIAAPYFSDELQIINLSTNSIRLHNLNTQYNKLIKPMSSISDAEGFTNQERNEYVRNNYVNIGFVYDKYRDVYYKFIRYPLEASTQMSCNIIVFDKNFKKLFETSLNPDIYSPSQYFITEKGLAVLNQEKYQKNATNLAFDLFLLKK